MEYPGYNHHWLIGQRYRLPYGYEPQPTQYVGHDQYIIPCRAQLGWPTEIPVKLRVSICCERCRINLFESLRNLQGVYDVGIAGTSNALVTVTGTALRNSILETARTVFNDAQLWSDNSYHYSWH